ncbi:unnamed protein product [Prorocentrum cordatum]|uniref:Isopropylmalate dehydrogenase-like domain-containing protein n=1 Tax=Prorocentrum cordatum TaxID=2364126 RepID=A0ABN9U5N0_9DINO|nr:unnamed protein product [Polarella glacialis]
MAPRPCRSGLLPPRALCHGPRRGAAARWGPRLRRELAGATRCSASLATGWAPSSSAAKHVLAATGVEFDYEEMAYGRCLQEASGCAVTEEHLQAIERIGCVLKGPIEVPSGEQADGIVELRGRRFTSANQALRKLLSLYANVRPARNLGGIGAKFPGTDIVVVRENTEGMYVGEEAWEGGEPGRSAVATRRITREGSLRVARFAFTFAERHGRRLVTAAHKANVLRLSDGLFLECCRQVAKEFPGIEYSEQLCDSLLTAMVLEPQKWDVIVCENLYGDLVSDLAAGLVGGLGLAPSALFGSGSTAIFEPAHGSAPDIAGKPAGLVNPSSMLLSAAMLLGHVGEEDAQQRLVDALEAVIAEGQFVTRDLGGSSGTQAMAQAAAAKLMPPSGGSHPAAARL